MEATRRERNAARARRGSWIGLALFYLLLVVVPFAIYFVLYVDARLEQAMVRNFRALDAAAERLADLVENLPTIAGNAASTGFSPSPADPPSEPSRRITPRTAQCLSNELERGLRTITAAYLDDFHAAAPNTRFRIEPLRRSGAAEPGNGVASPHVVRCIDELQATLAAEPADRGPTCKAESVSRRLYYDDDEGGLAVEVRDCRPLSQRAGHLWQALPSEVLRQALDAFGIRIVIGLESLVGGVAANVAPLFDQFVITDANGRVLYSGDAATDTLRFERVIGARTGHRVRRDFINQVDLRGLVQREPTPGVRPLDGSLSRLEGSDAEPSGRREWARYGVHSRVEELRVADLAFSAFVHPFVIAGLRGVDADANTDRTISELYMVGIINRDSLTSEALELRLATVADALLLIGVLFASFSLLWLWTAGDRLVLATAHFVLLLVTGMTVALLYALFAAHLITRTLDGHALDDALGTTSTQIRADLRHELTQRVEDLAVATREMIVQHGEAPARRSSPPGTAAAGSLAEQFYCRPPSGPWPRAQRTGDVFPRFDLTFLLDRSGRQWQCLSYRLSDTAPLNLSFRRYYRNAASGRLWPLNPPASTATQTLRTDLDAGQTQGSPGWPARAPRIYIDRITSVLDGTIETVLSARPQALCAFEDAAGQPFCEPDELPAVDAAVVIGRLHSLEEAILPPHLRLAVVHNDSGETLFHSVRSRALATNFLRETEGDDALVGLIDARASGLVDLNHHGTSIRAYVAPVSPHLPWTLIIYRGHEIEDTLGFMAVSLAALDALSAWALFILILAALWWVLGRSSVARLWPARAPGLVHLRRAERYLAALAAVTTVLLIATHRVLPGALVWVAFLTLLGALLLLIVAARGTRARPGSTSAPAPLDPREARHRLIRTVALLVLVVGMLPAAGFYSHHRAELSTALAGYLRGETLRSITDKCIRHRDYAARYKPPYGAASVIDGAGGQPQSGVFTFGWPLVEQGARAAPPTSRDLPDACATFPGAAERWQAVVGALGAPEPPGLGTGSVRFAAATGFSDFATDIFVRVRDVRPTSAFATPRRVLSALLPTADSTTGSRLSIGASVGLLATLLGGALLIWLIVRSLVDRVLGGSLRIALLPELHAEAPPPRWLDPGGPALRACVIHNSRGASDALVGALRAGRFGDLRTARFADGRIAWLSECAEPAHEWPPTLHVVADLEALLADGTVRSALLAELERLLESQESILICSRVLPGFWLARMLDGEPGDVAHTSAGAALTTRWSRVLGAFEAHRLCAPVPAADPARPNAEKHRELVRELLQAEARAHPDLRDLAEAIAAGTTAAPSSASADAALARFTVAAASHFHELWAVSTREERLQLYALAKGGFANPVETAVLTSLANRDLVCSEGLVRLRSAAFGRFIAHDLVHDRLLAWRDEGHGNTWRSIWPPVVVFIVLALAFFVSSTPEALAPLAALLAAGLGAIPVVSSLIRSFRDLRQSDTQA